MVSTSKRPRATSLALTSGMAEPPPPRRDRSHGVGAALKKLRLAKGFRQADVAHALGMRSISAYSKLETGDSPITIEQLYAVTRFLGYEIDITLKVVQ